MKKTIHQLISDRDCPLDINVIPDKMGINLCNVDSIEWNRQSDGQLTDLKINFVPSRPIVYGKMINFGVKDSQGDVFLKELVLRGEFVGKPVIDLTGEHIGTIIETKRTESALYVVAEVDESFASFAERVGLRFAANGTTDKEPRISWIIPHGALICGQNCDATIDSIRVSRFDPVRAVHEYEIWLDSLGEGVRSSGRSDSGCIDKAGVDATTKVFSANREDCCSGDDAGRVDCGETDCAGLGAEEN